MSKPKHPFENNTPENVGWNLCVLTQQLERGGRFLYGHSQFINGRVYRVSFDEDQKGALVYGEWMPIEMFNKTFSLYIPILLERLKVLDMLDNGKPVTFKKFKETVSIHNYGRGTKRLKIIFIGHPKENLFAFYPMQAPNPIALKECYENYVALVNGDWTPLDLGVIIWGNSGIPICYGEIRYRD
jgi:hypothetical protein